MYLQNNVSYYLNNKCNTIRTPAKFNFQNQLFLIKIRIFFENNNIEICMFHKNRRLTKFYNSNLEKKFTTS